MDTQEKDEVNIMLGTLFGARKLVDSAGSAALKIRTALTGEMPPDTRVQLEEIAANLEEKIVEGQSRLNIIDAGKGLFYAGWRPMVAWLSVTALGLYTIGNWSVDLISDYFALELTPIEGDMSTVLYILGALLGIGGMRTYEKYKGVNNKH